MAPPKEASGVAAKARPARKLRDKAAPRRPISPYIVFSIHERPKVQSCYMCKLARMCLEVYTTAMASDQLGLPAINP